MRKLNIAPVLDLYGEPYTVGKDENERLPGTLPVYLRLVIQNLPTGNSLSFLERSMRLLQVVRQWEEEGSPDTLFLEDELYEHAGKIIDISPKLIVGVLPILLKHELDQAKIIEPQEFAEAMRQKE